MAAAPGGGRHGGQQSGGVAYPVGVIHQQQAANLLAGGVLVERIGRYGLET